jgi:hypothetical protein
MVVMLHFLFWFLITVLPPSSVWKSNPKKRYYICSFEVTGEWRKLHNEELRDLYSSPSIIRIIRPRRMRWAGHVARMGEKRNAYRLLVGKPEGKRPLGRPRRRWVDNIRMDVGELGWSDVDWIGLAQGRNRWRALVNSVLNLRVP